MKLITKLLAVVGLCAVGIANVQAQGQFDVYEAFRTIQVTPAHQLFNAGAGIYSNKPVDIHASIGIAKLTLFVATNCAGNTTLATVRTSPDQTNYTTIANIAFTNATTDIIYTNFSAYSGVLYATNTVLLPAVVVTPTAYTAGFNTSYPAFVSFNSNGVWSTTGQGIAEMGIPISDQNRYMTIEWSGSGTQTNVQVAAVLTVHRTQ